MTEFSFTIFSLAFIALVIVLYFLPSFIAYKRELASLAPLFVVNLLLGFTVIGWFACLLWAALGQTRDQATFYARAARQNDRPG